MRSAITTPQLGTTFRPLYSGSGADADATLSQRHRTPPGHGDSFQLRSALMAPEHAKVAHRRSVRASLDDLVGFGEDQGRERGAERCRRFEVDDQLIFGRL